MRHEAILKLYPEAHNCVNQNAYDVNGEKIELDEQKIKEEINDKIAELQAEYDSKQYQRDRAEAYDPIPEQLDQIYWDMDGWKKRIKAVKDKFPKPTE